MFPHIDILRLLRANPMPLSDLQHETQVSLPTLRKAVQELTEARWIRIVGQADANSGRPPKIFGLDSSYFLIVGVHLQLPGMHLVTMDLSGRVLDEQRVIQEAVTDPNDVFQVVVNYVQLVRAKFTQRAIVGIGIAAPGFIDPLSGDILLIGRVPSWQGIPICTRLRAQLELPVHVGNDVDCMAFAEFHWSGIALDQNLIYVGFDEGVKASLFLNGELYKGALGNAGLIASHLLQVEGEASVADTTAALSIHGVNAIFSRRLTELPSDERAAYEVIAAIEDPRQRFSRILQCDGEAFPVCRDVLKLVIEVVAAAVANLVFVMQPNTCVLGGMLGFLPPEGFADLERKLRAHLPPIINHKVAIQLGQVAAANSAAVGAAHFFLEHYLTGQDDVLTASQTPHEPAMNLRE